MSPIRLPNLPRLLGGLTAGAALSLALSSFPAEAAEYTQVQPAKSQITFVSRQMGVPVNGRFKRFAASLDFDPAKPEKARASIDLELASIDAGSAEATQEVQGASWFNVKTYPKASFVASQVKPLGNGRYEVRGPLTLKGKSREVIASFQIKEDASGATIDGSFPLSRAAYGVGEGTWADPSVVADEVRIQFHLLALPVGKR